jgi:hypothetical protein
MFFSISGKYHSPFKRFSIKIDGVNGSQDLSLPNDPVLQPFLQHQKLSVLHPVVYLRLSRRENNIIELSRRNMKQVLSSAMQIDQKQVVSASGWMDSSRRRNPLHRGVCREGPDHRETLRACGSDEVQHFYWIDGEAARWIQATRGPSVSSSKDSDANASCVSRIWSVFGPNTSPRVIVQSAVLQKRIFFPSDERFYFHLRGTLLLCR